VNLRREKRRDFPNNRKKRSRSFLSTCYLKTQRINSRSIQNLLRKERNQEIGAVRDMESSLVSKQCGQLSQCSLGPETEGDTLHTRGLDCPTVWLASIFTAE